MTLILHLKELRSWVQEVPKVTLVGGTAQILKWAILASGSPPLAMLLVLAWKKPDSHFQGTQKVLPTLGKNSSCSSISNK